MQSETFLLDLQQLFSEADGQIVAAALRQDPLVWSSLQTEEFYATAKKMAGANTQAWSPANLALAWLQIDEPIENLMAYPLIPLDAEVRQRVADTYEKTLQDHQAPQTLADAGLIALALRERRRLTESWNGLLAELQVNAMPAATYYDLWRTPFACLFGMTADKNELLQALVPPSLEQVNPEVINLAIHAVLSNPLSVTEQSNLLVKLIAGYAAEDQLVWLKQMETFGCHALVVQVAGQLLIQEEKSPKNMPLPAHSAEKSYLYNLPEYRMGNYYQYADNPGMSLPYLMETQSALRRIQAHVARRIADTCETKADYNQAIQARQDVLALESGSPAAKAELANTLIDAGKIEDAASALEGTTNEPALLIARSRLAVETGDLAQAQECSLSIIDVLDANAKSSPKGLSSHPKSNIRFVKTLMDIGLTDEAIQIAETLRKEQPSNLELIQALAQAYLLVDDPQRATEVATYGAMVQPENIQIRRTLAESYEKALAWEQALSTRKDVLERSDEVSEEDLHTLAHAAIQAGKLEEAASVSRAALEHNAEDSTACSYLGEIELLRGDQNAAIDYYNRAALMAPEKAMPWLGLYQIYKAQENEEKSIEVLRQAVQAAPDSDEVQFAMGEHLLATNLPSEALPFLRHAASLNPKSIPYALRLSGVLDDLGHSDEAKEALEHTRQYWPNHPELAYTYAKLLINRGEAQPALVPLMLKLHTQPKEIEPYLLYANTLAGIQNIDALPANPHAKRIIPVGFNPLQSAHEALTKALEIDPASIEAKILLAENLLASGTLQEAYDLFLGLSETTSEDDRGWNGRIKLGLGKTCVSLGQIDAGLAALQEAAFEMPESLPTQQALAEAYLSANLNQEAHQAAQAALRLYPMDNQNLVWYAGLTYNLGIFPESIATLERACELSADPMENYLKMVQVYLQAENLASARSILSTITSSGQATPVELRKAAHGWLLLGDPDQAISALQNAIQACSTPNNTLTFELAQMLDQYHHPEEALQNLGKCLEIQPDQRPVYMAQARILAKNGRLEEALSALEMALRLPDLPASRKDAAEKPARRTTIPEISLPSFKSSQSETPFIHLEMASILRKKGQITEALQHATRALELDLADSRTAAIAADLAACQLDFDQAQSIVATSVDQLKSSNTAQASRSSMDIPEDEANASVTLLCLSADLALENDQIEEAKDLVSTAHTIRPNHPRLLATQARIAAMDGDLSLGENLYDQAINRLGQSTTCTPDTASLPARLAAFQETSSYNPVDELVFGYPTLTLAQTALELNHWDEAVQLFYQAAKNAPDEARSQLFLARALTICAENQRVLGSLKVVNHLPGTDKTGLKNLQMFEKAIQTADRLSSSALIPQWRRRGYAAFEPTTRNADLLKELPASADNAAAQALIAMQANDPARAMEVVKPFAHHPKALMQMALAARKSDPAEGFFAARSLVGCQQSNPLYQAALALSAKEVDEFEIARDAIESAISTWPNEPEWHYLASELAQQCGDAAQSLQHQTRAYEIDHNNPTYTLALANTYLKSGKAVEAVSILEDASHLLPDEVDVWVLLAEAQAQNANLGAALASAEKAISIAPDQLQPVITCGELALQAKQFDLAQQRAQGAVEMAPTDARASLLLVHVQEAQGKLAEALKTIDEAVNVVHDPYLLQLESVSLVNKLQGNAAALKVLQTLAQLYPDQSVVHARLAEALLVEGQREQAEKAAKTALKLSPNQPDLHLMLGRIQRSTGQLDQAIHHLAEAIRISPENIDAYLELGKVYSDRREHSQALNVYRQAIQTAPSDARPFYQAGLALKESKDYTGAEKMLRRAAELAPEDVNIRRQLGAIIALNLVRNLQEASK